MPVVSYRSLEHSCLRQASLTSDPEARKALEEMGRKYRDMADHEESHQKSKEVGGLFHIQPQRARSRLTSGGNPDEESEAQKPGQSFPKTSLRSPAGLKVEQVARSFKNDLPGFGSLHWARWRQTRSTKFEQPHKNCTEPAMCVAPEHAPWRGRILCWQQPAVALKILSTR